MNPFRHFGRIPWTGIGPFQGAAQHRKVRTFIPRVGFESTILVVERSKVIERGHWDVIYLVQKANTL